MGEITRLGVMAKVLLVLGLVTGTYQASTGCKHCSAAGKEDNAMFRAHSNACLAVTKADPFHVEALRRGELIDTPETRSHVYCVLLKCKVVGKNGKLLKAAIYDMATARPNLKDITKILESCSKDPYGYTPEDLAWDLFRCSNERKAILFDYMPSRT